jgi:hypothetical protein
MFLLKRHKMVTRTALINWANGNHSQMTKSDLIGTALYFENCFKHGVDDAEEQVEEDEEEYD